MAENYTDEDYHRLHRAHCHTGERLAAAEATVAELRRERLPHMCRDGHPEIRHADGGEDERCPVCREQDRAEAAEAERDELRGFIVDHARRIAEQAIEIDRLRGRRPSQADDDALRLVWNAEPSAEQKGAAAASLKAAGVLGSDA